MITPLYCRKCGTRLPPDSPFCPACGVFQTGNDQTPTTLPQQEPAMVGTGRLPPGRMLHQRYRLLHTVGQGGMGAVYVVQDTQLGDRLVAVKEMSMNRLTPQELPQAIEQFRREAHLLASLHHPNLPVIHEYFREDDRWYLVMSFIEGQNLQGTLQAAPGNRLPVKDVVRIGIELCGVLEYLHTHEPQVIFRDLKPPNIMLTPKGHICLIDFGIARHFKQEQAQDTAYYYSVGYAPPEQYGQSQTGPRSDIYSLGVTLHQMLSGYNPANKPFQFPNLQLVDPTLPVPLVKVITQMLEMNEQARPASVAEVRAQLEQVLVPGTIEPTKKTVAEEKVQIQASSRQHVTSTSTGNNLWGRIDSFLNKKRRAAWICFIVLSLLIGSILPWLSWELIWRGISDYAPFTISNIGIEDNTPPYITIIGALMAAGIGLMFLLTKKRRSFIDISGGIILSGIAFTNIALSSYSPYYAHNSYYYNRFMEVYPNYYFNFCVFLALFSLWLFVGTHFFLRSANMIGRLLLGTLLIIGGFLLLLLQGHFVLVPLTFLPVLICGACGTTAITVAIGKRKSNI